MGGGDLNMKKSWHPVLLVNQERVWKAEKSANEEKKMLAQLRKEREEERQLAELQRLQEATTGKKRVEKMDWMYAAPGNEGGALGGQKIGEREMEEYLLGKKRVDEVLARGDKDVGASHKDFIAVQNANSARDTASKIREDPLLAIRKQEQAALQALMNRPDIRKQLKAAKKEKESKEDRKARKKAEKEEKRSKKHDKDRRSPRSDHSDDRDRRHRRDSYDRRRDRSRSFSPKREREDRDHGSRKRYRDESPARRDDRDRRRDDDLRGKYRDDRDRSRDDRDRRRDDTDGHRRDKRDDDRNGRRVDYLNGDRDDPRIPPPRQYPSESRDIKPHPSRPSALDMADRPTTSSRSQPTPPSANVNGNGQSLDDMRAARLAAMQSSATEMYDQRTKTLAQRAEEDRKESERDEKMRARYGQEQASAGFFKQQSGMNLSETLSRRAGKGLLKDI